MSLAFGAVVATYADNSAASTSITLTTTGIVPAGALVLVMAAFDNSGSSTPTATCGWELAGVETFTSASDRTGTSSTAGAEVRWYCWAARVLTEVPAGASFTITLSAAVTARVGAALYWTSNTSGAYAYAPTWGATSATTATSRAPAVTTTSDGGLAVCIGAAEGGDVAVTEGTTRVAVGIGSGATGASLVVADTPTPTAGTYTFTVTQSVSNGLLGKVLAVAEWQPQAYVIDPVPMSYPGIFATGATVPTTGQLWPRGNN